MSHCKEEDIRSCVQDNECKVAKGEKRTYCRRAKNRPRCPKTMRRNQRTGKCYPYTKKKKKASNLLSLEYSPLRESVLKEYDIHSENFFVDPCVLLKKLKRYIGKDMYDLKKPQLEAIKQIMPTLQPSGKNDGNYFFGKHKVTLGTKIGSGSYGDIFKAKYNGSKIIIKIPKTGKFDFGEYISETLVQNELFCKYRGSWGSDARIPKIEFFAKMKIGNKFVGVIAMEPLEHDGFYLLNKATKSDKYELIFKQMLLKVGGLLKSLQKSDEFMHRDLHAGNVMYKKVGESYKWYIIDFGMTMMKLEGKLINVHQSFPYTFNHEFNASHDMRMLLTSMFGVFRDNLLNYGVSTVPKNIFLLTYRFMESLSRYMPTGKRVLFHNTYEDVVKVYDENFTPDYLMNIFSKANIKSKMDFQTLYSIFISNKIQIKDKQVSFIPQTKLTTYLRELRRFLPK